MNQILIPIQRFWLDRTTREQIMLAAAGMLVLVLFVQLFAVRPLMRAHARASDDYAAMMRHYRSFEADIGEYRALNAANPDNGATASQPLRTVVGSLALSHGIAIARMVPDDNGQLTVNIARAETRALMRWLIDLESRYGIEVVSTTLDRDADDYVEAHLVLQRRGG